MAAALSYQSKWGIGPAAGGVATVALDFQSSTLGLTEQLKNLTGLRGTRSRQAARTRAVGRQVGGSVTLTPSPVEMAAVLQYCLGGTPSGTSYPTGEALVPFTSQMTKGAKLFTHTPCLVDRMALRGSKSNPLEMTLDILGVDETVGASSGFPSLAAIDATTVPFIFEDAVMTVGGTTVEIFDLNVQLNNFVIARQVNSQTPTSLFSSDRLVTWDMTVPYEFDTLYGLAVGGVAVVATFTNGTVSLILSSPKVSFPRKPVEVPGRGSEIRLALNGEAGFSSAAGDEIAVTLDSTP